MEMGLFHNLWVQIPPIDKWENEEAQRFSFPFQQETSESFNHKRILHQFELSGKELYSSVFGLKETKKSSKTMCGLIIN
jgi:hypothetical protein